MVASMTRAAAWLAELAAATGEADRAEQAWRAESLRRAQELADARAFAWRRANLLRAVAQSVAAAEDEAGAVADGLACLRERLGWAANSAAREEIVQAFAPVCAELHACGQPEEEGQEPPDPAAALAAFEAWYQAARGTPFWILFETYMPETPVVDF